MKFKKLFPILLLIFSVFQIKCSQDEQICEDIETINKELNLEINSFYNQSEEWNLDNSNMSHINRVLENLRREFDLLNSSIIKTETTVKKNGVIEVLDNFINRKRVNQKRNKDYLWIIIKARDEIEILKNNENLCSQITLNKSHTIEMNLVNTLYLTAYTNNYTFNKAEPIVKIVEDFSTEDSISFILAHFAYDSTAFSTTQVSVINEKGVFKDSAINWLSIPRIKGINTFKGKYYFEMNGKAEVMSFEEEIYVK